MSPSSIEKECDWDELITGTRTFKNGVSLIVSFICSSINFYPFQNDLYSISFTEEPNTSSGVPVQDTESESPVFQKEHSTAGPDSESQLPKVFKCYVCNEGFAFGNLLKEHIQSFHKTKPNSCSECHMSFVSNLEFKRHFKGCLERSFTCSFCRKTFSSSVKLNTHMFKYHPKQYIRVYQPLQCFDCGKRFALFFQLQRHVKVHKRIP